MIRNKIAAVLIVLFAVVSVFVVEAYVLTHAIPREGASEVAAGVRLYGEIANDPNTPACEVEDGSDLLEGSGAACRWDADDAGNGVGDSFVVIAVPDQVNGGRGLIYVYADGHMEV